MSQPDYTPAAAFRYWNLGKSQGWRVIHGRVAAGKMRVVKWTPRCWRIPAADVEAARKERMVSSVEDLRRLADGRRSGNRKGGRSS